MFLPCLRYCAVWYSCLKKPRSSIIWKVVSLVFKGICTVHCWHNDRKNLKQNLFMYDIASQSIGRIFPPSLSCPWLLYCVTSSPIHLKSIRIMLGKPWHFTKGSEETTNDPSFLHEVNHTEQIFSTVLLVWSVVVVFLCIHKQLCGCIVWPFDSFVYTVF